MLQSCSQQPIVRTEEVPIYAPDNLLFDPCSATEAGVTVRSLAAGYIENTSCIYKYETVLKSLRDWKAQQQLIYKKE